MEPLESNNNAPYHTKFFDIITIPPPPPPEQEQGINPEKNLLSFLNSFNSIMYYEDAILDAIRDLRDGHNGSNVHAIQKHIQANFFQEYENNKHKPHLNNKNDHPHQQQEAEWWLFSCSSLNNDDNMTPPQWKEHLFVQALKSLVEKNCIEYSPCGVHNGSCLYKLSHDYKKHRAEELTLRMERLKQYKLQQQEKQRQILMEQAKSGKKSSTTSRPLVHKQPSILKKGHLVESKTVTIVDNTTTRILDADERRKNSMDLDRNGQKEKRMALPHHTLVLHADDDSSIGSKKERKKKGLRDQCKIPHGKIYVKEM
jgi:hypothetical protein